MTIIQLLQAIQTTLETIQQNNYVASPSKIDALLMDIQTFIEENQIFLAILNDLNFDEHNKDKISIFVERTSNNTIAAWNYGFTPFELLGVYTARMDDILRQIRKEVVPDTVKISRTVIKDA